MPRSNEQFMNCLMSAIEGPDHPLVPAIEVIIFFRLSFPGLSEDTGIHVLPLFAGGRRDCLVSNPNQGNDVRK